MGEPYPVLTALRLLRQARGMSQEDAAEAIGVGRATLIRWECGTSDPSFAGLIAYANLFGLRLTFEIADSENADG